MKAIRSMAVTGLLLSGCMTTASDQPGIEAAEFKFDRHEIVTGFARQQTVLTGFFLGGTVADLAVVSIGENGGRHLSIYSLEGDDWSPKIETGLSAGLHFFDVVNISGRDRLIMYEHGRLNWFDPVSESVQTLIEVDMGYRTGFKTTVPDSYDDDEIPRVDISRDLNGDGLDEVILPDLDGFRIFTQLSGGSFSDPVKLGPPEPFLDEVAVGDKHSYRSAGINAVTIPWYLSRVHQVDYDRDGRDDLVFWNEDHFEVHLQDMSGQFGSVNETFTVDAPFDSDGTYSLIFGFSDDSTFQLITGFRKKTSQTVLHSFRDMNGDRIADLMTRTLEGRSGLKQRNVFKVYFGTSVPGGTVFAADAGMTIRSPRGNRGGQPLGYSYMTVQDFNNDGQVDITLARINTGISKMIRAIVGNSVTMDLDFYRIEDGRVPGHPTTTRKIRPKTNTFSGRGPFFPAVMGGDVTGDGHADLLVGMTWEELHIFAGIPGPELFVREPQIVALAMPNNERDAWLADFNRDDIQDLLIRHVPKDPAAGEPHRMTILIAR